MKEAPPHAQN